MKKRVCKLIFALLVITLLLPKTAHATVRQDSSPSEWAQEGIIAADNLGLVPPFLLSDFTRQTTRAEFAKLSTWFFEKVTGDTIAGLMEFNDTDDINVKKMGYLGVVIGVGNGNFAPNDAVTREQAAVMLSRLTDAIGLPLPPWISEFQLFSAERDIISSWALESVLEMYKAGVMIGVGDIRFAPRFDPHGTFTREQSIITVLRLFELLDFVRSEIGADIVSFGTITENGSRLPWRLHADGTLVVGAGNIYWTSYRIDTTGARLQTPWAAYRNYVREIVFTGPVVGGRYIRDLFASLPKLTRIEGLHFFDNSGVWTTRFMFSGTGFTSLDLSGFDISGVTNIDGMFGSMSALTSLDLSEFNTSSVTSMSGLFSGSGGLTTLDLSAFDTSNVTHMGGMFNNATGLTSLDLSHFDTRNVRFMWHMFQGASALTSIDLSGWDISGPVSMIQMFHNASSLTSLDLSGWDTRNSSMVGMFYGATSLRELTLGENFVFNEGFMTSHPPTRLTADLPPPPQNEEFTGFWQNVGSGTTDNPQGEFVFTSEDLMEYFDGAIHADTWVWQRTA
jgi:surface protein